MQTRTKVADMLRTYEQDALVEFYYAMRAWSKQVLGHRESRIVRYLVASAELVIKERARVCTETV